MYRSPLRRPAAIASNWHSIAALARTVRQFAQSRQGEGLRRGAQACHTSGRPGLRMAMERGGAR